MKLIVIDGQGGGIGASVIKALRESVGNQIDIAALGTNSIATSRMMKHGANKGGSGENAIVHSCASADLIIGPLGILMANAMMGEVTPAMAAAVASSPAHKVIIPLTQESITVVGTSGEPLPHLVTQVITILKEKMKDV